MQEALPLYVGHIFRQLQQIVGAVMCHGHVVWSCGMCGGGYAMLLQRHSGRIVINDGIVNKKSVRRAFFL